LSFKDFVVPVGVVFGAIIGAFVAWWNNRKTVYDRLETLVKITKDWPETVAGRDAVERSISLALAEIRQKEHVDAETTPLQVQAQADRTVRRQTRGSKSGSSQRYLVHSIHY
jgi:hypothetical protein